MDASHVSVACRGFSQSYVAIEHARARGEAAGEEEKVPSLAADPFLLPPSDLQNVRERLIPEMKRQR